MPKGKRSSNVLTVLNYIMFTIIYEAVILNITLAFTKYLKTQAALVNLIFKIIHNKTCFMVSDLLLEHLT